MLHQTHGLDRLIDYDQLDLDAALVRVMISTIAPGLAELVERGAAEIAHEFRTDSPLARYAASELIVHQLAELLTMESNIDRAAVLRPAMLQPNFLTEWYEHHSTIIENKLR